MLTGVCLLTSRSSWWIRSPTMHRPSSSISRNLFGCEERSLCPSRAAAGDGLGGGLATSQEPLGNFLKVWVNFLSTMHRPKPRSRAALLMMSASSIS